MNDEQDRILIQRILSGHREEYARIVEKYSKPIYNLVIRLTGQNQDTDDLTQEIFIKVYESLSRFDQNKRFFPWLYTIALNVIRNYKKKAKKEPTLNLENQDADTASRSLSRPDLIVSRKQLTERLNQYIQGLPESLQEAIVLRYYQDCSFKEVADVLGVSLSAAKMRVYRGLKALAERIGE